MDKTLLSILSGLGGMLGWGTSDFLANSASEKVGHHRSLFWSQVAGMILIGACVLVFNRSLDLNPLLLGLTILGGIMYAVGYLFFYKGFEIGNVSVVSATINLQVLFAILISFFVRGQQLTSFQIPALIILLTGISLVSLNFDHLKEGKVGLLKGVKETLTAAIVFGIFYWPLNEYLVEQADWIFISFLIKVVALSFLFLLSWRNKTKLKIKNNTRLYFLIAAVGILEALGILSASFGQSYGDGIIVAPIASALTIVTVTLAMIFSNEKINRLQAFGILLAIAGIVMTAF